MNNNIRKISSFEIFLLLFYFCIFLSFSFAPAFRILWFIENSIAFLLLGIIIALRFSGVQWSKTALSIVLLACIAQMLGGYFTFQKVPYGEYLFLWGNAGRNNFDRFGHFLCGMLSYPLLEYLQQKVNPRQTIINSLLALLVLSGIGAIYEEIEWGIVQITEARTGLTYIGMQGDEWDAQADMFCCTIGACIGIIIYHCMNRKARITR